MGNLGGMRENKMAGGICFGTVKGRVLELDRDESPIYVLVRRKNNAGAAPGGRSARIKKRFYRVT